MVDERLAGRQLLTRAELLRDSPPMFASPLLDRVTRVHPAVPPLVFLPAIGTFAAFAFRGLAVLGAVSAFAGGYAIWTLSEYWIHRIVFHFEPKHRIGARLHWIVHGVHHDHPNDPRRLVMPPVVSLPLGSAFFGAFVGTFGLPLAWGVAAGFFAGYLFYDMLHFALHHSKPKSRIGRRLRELHMRHHFEDETCGFAVSAPWWDRVFRTYSPRARRKALAAPVAKLRLRDLSNGLARVEHAGIYALIAGSYTPLGLLVLNDEWRVVVLSIVWSGAVAAVALKLCRVAAPTWLSAVIAIVLGWVGVIVFPQVVSSLGVGDALLVLFGGLAYTAGGLVYARRRPDPLPGWFGYQEVFHSLVLVAVAVQCAAIALYVL